MKRDWSAYCADCVQALGWGGASEEKPNPLRQSFAVTGDPFILFPSNQLTAGQMGICDASASKTAGQLAKLAPQPEPARS